MIESCAATEASAQQRACQIFFSLDDQACLRARVLFNGRGKLEKNTKKNWKKEPPNFLLGCFCCSLTTGNHS